LSGLKPDNRGKYSDISTVESQRNDLTTEEFSEGSYGTDIASDTLSKSTPWRIEQHSPSPFGYEDHELHAEQEEELDTKLENNLIPDAIDEP